MRKNPKVFTIPEGAMTPQEQLLYDEWKAREIAEIIGLIYDEPYLPPAPVEEGEVIEP